MTFVTKDFGLPKVIDLNFGTPTEETSGLLNCDMLKYCSTDIMLKTFLCEVMYKYLSIDRLRVISSKSPNISPG